MFVLFKFLTYMPIRLPKRALPPVSETCFFLVSLLVIYRMMIHFFSTIHRCLVIHFALKYFKIVLMHSLLNEKHREISNYNFFTNTCKILKLENLKSSLSLERNFKVILHVLKWIIITVVFLSRGEKGKFMEKELWF